MNDQELLTYAAKAIDLKWLSYHHLKGLCCRDDKYGGLIEYYWNPLESDADAFQLMVNLHMSVRHMSWLSKDAWKIQVGVCMDFLTEQKCGDDPLQAARRAIVEMAAEIGKGM